MTHAASIKRCLASLSRPILSHPLPPAHQVRFVSVDEVRREFFTPATLPPDFK